jgi:molybdate transport system substrate-binding protein
MKRRLASLLVAALAVASGIPAGAAELSLIAPGGIKAAVEALIPDFERTTGNTVKATFGSGAGTKAQVVRGDPFDVPIVQPPYDAVLASGHVVAGSAAPLATVSVGIAVRPGTAKPDIATADAVKRLLLGAKGISYPDAAAGAAAGVSFVATLRKLGLADALKPKLKIARTGAGAMELLEQGEVDVGVTFVSEIITVPGVVLVGPLPRNISPPTAFVAFVSAQSSDKAAAQALVSYLASPAAAAVYKAKGMLPGR